VSVLAAGPTAGVTEQLVQVVGAVLVLTAFAAAQYGALGTRSTAYLLLNLVGAGVLAVLAAADRQIGFLLLEGMWAAVSAWSLMRRRDETDKGRPGGRPYGVAGSGRGLGAAREIGRP
jgi:hypothetical protein